MRLEPAKLGPRDIPLILMYHAIDYASYDPNLVAVSPDQFAVQLDWLTRHRLRGVAVGTLVTALRTGGARGLVGITFDDGYTTVLAHAVPELRRHGFTATVFVVSDRVGQTNDWDDGTPWPLLSRSQIGELADAEVRGFAYPYGDMDAAARRAVRDAGYDYACAVQTPRAALGLMALPRVYVGQRDGPGRMTAKRLLYRRRIIQKGNRQ